jgi:hypothetical protein
MTVKSSKTHASVEKIFTLRDFLFYYSSNRKLNQLANASISFCITMLKIADVRNSKHKETLFLVNWRRSAQNGINAEISSLRWN